MAFRNQHSDSVRSSPVHRPRPYTVFNVFFYLLPLEVLLTAHNEYIYTLHCTQAKILAFLGSSANLRMCLVIPMMTRAAVIIGLLYSNMNVSLNLVHYNYVPNRCDYSYDKICSLISCFHRAILKSITFIGRLMHSIV